MMERHDDYLVIDEIVEPAPGMFGLLFGIGRRRHKVWRFPNGWGLSWLRFLDSDDQEMAVVFWESPDDDDDWYGLDHDSVTRPWRENSLVDALCEVASRPRVDDYWPESDPVDGPDSQD